MMVIMTLTHLCTALCCLQSPSLSITSLDPPNGLTRQIDGAYCFHLLGEGARAWGAWGLTWAVWWRTVRAGA